jgi:hypothetical protein
MIEAEVNRFDFEQQIFDCWHVTKDLDAMYKHACESYPIDPDEITNVLLGMKQLYDIKFNQLFDTFEALVRQQKL